MKNQATAGGASSQRLLPVLAGGVGLGLLYYAAARFGLLLAFEKSNASPVWPPAGIALAGLLLLGWLVSRPLARNPWTQFESRPDRGDGRIRLVEVRVDGQHDEVAFTRGNAPDIGKQKRGFAN